MKKIKVVITHPSQLFERWINYYCMDELAKEFDLEYWDCSPIVTPSYVVKNPVKRSYLKIISSIEDFRTQISILSPKTVLISEVYQCAENYDFHKIQSKYFPNILHFNFYGNTINRIDLEDNNTDSERIIYKKSLKSLLYRSVMLKKIIKWLFHHKDSDFKKQQLNERCANLYKGSWEISCINETGKRINHPDFENYLNLKDSKKIINNDYVVFIDTYYPFHSESFFFENTSQCIEEIAKQYHTSMNNYFERIEKTLGIPVVIAAHPYADYNERNPFNGRDVFYYQTDKLIKDCKAVCMHGSNAYSYVALFNKPVNICINSAIRGTFFGNMAELCAQKFHMHLFDIDYSTSQYIYFELMDNNLRLRYINKYLGEIDNPQSNKQLIINYIKEYYAALDCN